MRRDLLVLLLMPSVVVHAATEERFLGPAYTPVPVRGVFGSRWITELQVLNTGPDEAQIENYILDCVPCFLPATFPVERTVRANQVQGWSGISGRLAESATPHAYPARQAWALAKQSACLRVTRQSERRT